MNAVGSEYAGSQGRSKFDILSNFGLAAFFAERSFEAAIHGRAKNVRYPCDPAYSLPTAFIAEATCTTDPKIRLGGKR